MIEIETLQCFDVLAIALLMLAVDVVMMLWNTRGTRMTGQEMELLKQYNAQVLIVNRLNSVETFVAQSKAIRQMNTIKKQMQELAVERMQKAAPSVFQKRIDQIRTPLIMGALLFFYWKQPLVVLPQGYMLPLERLLSFPGFPFGSISAVGWAGLCRRVNAKLIG